MDGPNFEPGAILLSASLRWHMGETIPIEACVPNERLAKVTDLAHKVLEANRVAIRGFDAKADWKEPYPHGNKIVAACLPRPTPASVFFDTDTICTTQLDLTRLGDPHTVMAVPEGVATWGRRERDWAPLYAEFGLDIPSERIRLTRGRRRKVLPYFNAGLVGFSQAKGHDDQTFPEVWLDTALRLDRMAIENRRPWLDQIALPLAAARMGAKLDVRGASYNFSLHRRDPVDDLRVHLMHYHLPRQYRKWAQCRAVTDYAIDRCPPPQRQALTSRLRPFIRARQRVSS